MNEQQFDEVIAVHLKGHFVCARAAAAYHAPDAPLPSARACCAALRDMRATRHNEDCSTIVQISARAISDMNTLCVCFQESWKRDPGLLRNLKKLLYHKRNVYLKW